MRKKTRKTRVVVLSVEGLDKRITPSGGATSVLIGPSQPVTGGGGGPKP